jgi:GNAT superfamily N-acetyltransferase
MGFGGTVRSVRQAIWSSAAYRRARQTAADLTRPFRRFELALMRRQDLTGPIRLVEADVEIDIAQVVSADEIDAAFVDQLDSRRRENFRWRLENGCICFVARSASRLVAYNWVRFRPGIDDGDMIALAEREAFHLDTYVEQNWRGHRIGAALSSRMRLFEQQLGCSTVYAKVSVFNRKSIKSGRRAGWRPAGLVVRRRGSRRGGRPIVTLCGSAYPLTRLRRT